MRTGITPTLTTTGVAAPAAASPSSSDGSVGQNAAHVVGPETAANNGNDTSVHSLAHAMGQLVLGQPVLPQQDNAYAGKYYVVFKGRRPGIYQSWPESQRQTNGFPGAVHRSYPSYPLAVAAWNEEVRLQADQTAAERVPVATTRTYAYVVLQGLDPGVYSTWVEAQAAVGSVAEGLYRRAATVSEGNAAFVAAYRAGRVVRYN